MDVNLTLPSMATSTTSAFVSADGKHLALRWSEALARAIPHARKVSWDGEPWLVVPNGSEEARVARNLGASAPPPILTRYDWRGSRPWDIQKTTAALLTESARCYVLSSMGCVDADTDYLAPDGWHRIADYTHGQVAEYRPETGTIAFVEPTEFVKLPCQEMIRFKTTRGVDQLLSPEHRVLYVDWKGEKQVASAEDVYNRYDTASPMSTRFITTFRVEGGTPAPLTDAQLRLHVAITADGYNPYGDKINVRVKKPRKIARMHTLLRNAAIDYNDHPVAPEGFRTFTFNWPYAKGFSGGFAITQHQLEVVADEAAHWDGSHRKAGGRAFSSFRKEEADFIQFAYAASGCRASLGVSIRERRGKVEHEWRVHAMAQTPLASLGGVDNDGQRKRNVWREPSPDGFKYCFMVPSTFLLLRRNGCIFATGNTGKSRAVLYAADWLMRTGQARKLLIVAPLSTLTPVWEREIFLLMIKSKVVVLHGSRQKRLDLLKENTPVAIINHHGLKVMGEALRMAGFDILVFDELATFRNKRTDLWRSAKDLVDLPTTRFVWGLTGSPTPNAPTDAWAQVRLLTPSRTTRTFTQFQDQTMQRISQFRWLPKPGANQLVHTAMSPSVRYTRDDVMELPPCSTVERSSPLEGEAARAYRMLYAKARMLAEKSSEPISAANEGVLHNKLLQVSCGYIYTDSRTVYALPVPGRLRALDEVIGEADRKLLVLVPYLHALAGVGDYLRHKGHDVVSVHGGTSRGARDKIFTEFQTRTSPRIICAHPQTLQHGLTLTEANVVIWYSPTTSLEQYEQANARITRPGQTSKTLIVHMVGTPIESATYSRLRAKQSMMHCLLTLFKEQPIVY